MKIFKKILSVFMAAVIMVSGMCVTASAESIEDTAKEIDSGKKISFTPKVEVFSPKYKDYKITLSEKGTLKLKFETKSTAMCVKVMDENGDCIEPTKKSVTTGTTYFSSLHLYTELDWNKTMEKFKGTLSYSLSKGTYYVRIWAPAHSTVYGKTSVSFTYPQSNKEQEETGTISSLMITMKAGDKIQLGAVIEGEGEAKWSSSNSSVVSVTSKGKITAKKKGSAVITAKLGASTMKIKIKVT